MTAGGQLNRTRLLVVLAVLGALVLGSTAVDLVIGRGDSMEPRYQECDLLIVDTIRDTADAVHINDVIAFQTDSGLIVHEVVGVAAGEDYVLARGLNRASRERVTSDMIVGTVVAHLDTSWLCSVGA